jgi:hypothetical protein
VKWQNLVRPVDIAIRTWLQIPVPVVHNLEKAMMLQKIFWNLNVDGTSGCYIEFGVAHGHSMRAAEVSTRKTSSSSLNVIAKERKLYGFDTFEGFESRDLEDNHVTWNGVNFTHPLNSIQKRFRKSKNVSFIKVNVSNLASSKEEFIGAAEIGVAEKASVILFDMDLFEPTLAGLRWSRQLIKPGTYIIFDELYAFEGNPNRGESKALKMFLAENKGIKFQHFMSYGTGGQVFIVTSIEE